MSPQRHQLLPLQGIPKHTPKHVFGGSFGNVFLVVCLGGYFGRRLGGDVFVVGGCVCGVPVGRMSLGAGLAACGHLRAMSFVLGLWRKRPQLRCRRESGGCFSNVFAVVLGNVFGMTMGLSLKGMFVGDVFEVCHLVREGYSQDKEHVTTTKRIVAPTNFTEDCPNEVRITNTKKGIRMGEKAVESNEEFNAR